MSTYEAISLIIMFSMFIISLITLSNIDFKDVIKTKKIATLLEPEWL